MVTDVRPNQAAVIQAVRNDGGRIPAPSLRNRDWLYLKSARSVRRLHERAEGLLRAAEGANAVERGGLFIDLRSSNPWERELASLGVDHAVSGGLREGESGELLLLPLGAGGAVEANESGLLSWIQDYGPKALAGEDVALLIFEHARPRHPQRRPRCCRRGSDSSSALRDYRSQLLGRRLATGRGQADGIGTRSCHAAGSARTPQGDAAARVGSPVASGLSAAWNGLWMARAASEGPKRRRSGSRGRCLRPGPLCGSG
jgi:hypothetical protein